MHQGALHEEGGDEVRKEALSHHMSHSSTVMLCILYVCTVQEAIWPLRLTTINAKSPPFHFHIKSKRKKNYVNGLMPQKVNS